MDPITMMLIGQGVSLGAAAIGGALQYGQGQSIQKKSEGYRDQLMKQGLPKMETPQEYFDLYEKSKENRQAQIAQQQASQSYANVAEALSRGGSRAMIGGLSKAQNVYDMSSAQIGAQAQQAELSALGTLASAKAQAAGMNTQLGAQNYMNEMGYAMSGINAGASMKANAINQFLGTGAAVGQGMSRAAMMGAQDPEMWANFIGREGMKTPGEFNHDSNPIHLMRNGQKIGEATGGEYIFNPQQSKKLKQLAQAGNSPLHQYVAGLLNKFDKQSK